jgi:C4-dicarboxylate-specific signal transduction histidine kinase
VENWRTHTQLLKANNELKVFQSQMLQAAKLAAVGEMAASVVHEIKNPVQILSMQMEIVMLGRGQATGSACLIHRSSGCRISQNG